MKIQESAENYLESIYMIHKKKGNVRSIDIVNELDLSKPSVSVAMKNLRENGYTYSVLENLHYIPHVHGGLECVYVLDGELCATIDEKNYTLKKGDICLIFPQVRHSY